MTSLLRDVAIYYEPYIDKELLSKWLSVNYKRLTSSTVRAMMEIERLVS